MDTDLIRQQTKGCADKIFLNSAGSSLVPQSVTEKMLAYLQMEAIDGGYALAARFENEIKEFYVQAAILLNCAPENIAYTASSTDAYARAITAVDFKAGDVILTTDDDYISNQLSFLSLKERLGISIVRAKNLANGDLDLDFFEKLMIRHRPKLVAITHMPTNSGLVQPVEEVGRICRKYDVLYLLDACQSVGQRIVDVQKIGCDFLTATGRKFVRGPRGTGILYVSDKILDMQLVPLIFDMQGAEWTGDDSYKLAGTAKRFEFWECSPAAKIGLAEALKYINGLGIKNIDQYNNELMQYFRKALEKVDGLELHDQGTLLSNILTFTTKNRPLQDTAQLLKDHQVYFSMSFRDFARIDFNKKNLDGVIRFSPHYFNTIQELEKTIDILNY
ncbi:Selenocysteine lyase/Cysteine desulfurase [Pedobacter westerhofensis]|uniref:Selenocysteine lyase/Cysteine desulfurase n=1 Tax=Pedobacter westerhofensis TaxID=425512 RepID=A0A521FCB6_9SPHI|nr:aminotransferase class V-fold PLP-dependent enzyme [Pedobacter westerhofensis]SMO93241.1 Selenocysteine lyase/Cysteine desulfurase [Pedobacter westerhofensis]